jgi:hypothetical protein
MWSTRCERVANGSILKIAIDLESAPLPFSDVLRLWQFNLDFRSLFIRLLADVPFSAFRWETPPITATAAGRPFEFVVLDSPDLARRSDEDAFAEHFKQAGTGQDVVAG